MPKPEHPTTPDVEITASAKARELRFHAPPQVSVHATAEPTGECAWGSDRTNLPDQVEPHVTYRDIHIDFRLAARLTDPHALADSERPTNFDRLEDPAPFTDPKPPSS
ncbi:hypothetical protein [[Actinomadura] parvosata]|nr:hypothetical protein [Nonomuraea sp. ATCC 55076]